MYRVQRSVYTGCWHVLPRPNPSTLFEFTARRRRGRRKGSVVVMELQCCMRISYPRSNAMCYLTREFLQAVVSHKIRLQNRYRIIWVIISVREWCTEYTKQAGKPRSQQVLVVIVIVWFPLQKSWSLMEHFLLQQKRVYLPQENYTKFQK